MIAFRNPHLVKSVNLAFTHVLFRFVYHTVAPSNINVNRLELLASFLTPEQINLVRLISFRTGLIPTAVKNAAFKFSDSP